MTHNINHIVDETLHRAILEFDPDAEGSYQKWVEILEGLEKGIEAHEVDVASKRALLARVRSQLAVMASMAEEHDQVDRFTARVLEVASPEGPDLALAVLLRTKALHILGRHDEEIQEALRYAELKTFPGQSLLHLLSELARDHPGEIAWKDSLVSRIKEYTLELPEVSQRIEEHQLSEANAEEYLLGVKNIDRQLSRERLARARKKASEE